MQEQQEQIKTDWLVADWHDKEKSKRRRRRNFLPEAYRQLSKAEKQQVRAAAKWIRQRVSEVDWGRKLPDEKAGKPLPKPVNLKDQVVPYLSGTWGKRIRKLTLTSIIRHLVNDDTVYFTGGRGDEAILMIDIDCHGSGTLQGALQFAQHLKDHFFPGLYFETSTHGNGVHGFLAVDRRFWSDAQYKGVLGDVEKWLKRVLRSTEFDVEDVELKGAPMTVQWGAKRGEVRSVTYGSLAKMPRDWKRLEEWSATTRLTPHELRELPELYPVEETEPQVEAPRPVPKGSVLGKLVDPEVVKKLAPLARQLLSWGMPEVKRSSSRAVVVEEDVQIALAVIRACTLHMNPDWSMPLKRIAAIWQAAYNAGDTTRAFCYHRFAAIRNMLSDMGLLEWEDSTYRFGRACKWKVGEKLMEMMEEAIAGDCTSTPCVSPSVDRNNIREAIIEACQNHPEHVGLRPVRVYPSLLRTDWDTELRKAGLDHLSRLAA